MATPASSRSASLRSVDIPFLSDAHLASHWEGVLEHLRDGARIHFTHHAATCFPLAELAFASVELLGWGEARVWALLAGLSRMSTVPNRKLSALAEIAASRPDTRRVVVAGGADAVDRLRRADPEVAAELASYLDEFGMQALSCDPVTPALGEQPELVLGLMADQLSRGLWLGR